MTGEGLIQRARRFRLALLGLRLDRSCVVERHVSLGGQSSRRLGGKVEVGMGCELGLGVELGTWGGDIHVGHRVFLGPYSVIYGHGGVTIGDDCLIAMHCCILSSNHTVPDRSQLIRREPDVLLPTSIGRDVWLGAGVKVMGGVTIGDGCVVGAGAVVTKDLEPYTVCAGVPASVIGHRRHD